MRHRQHPQAEGTGWGLPVNKPNFGVLKKAEVGATCNIYVLGDLIRRITPTQPQDGEFDQIYPRGYIKHKSVRSIRGPRTSWPVFLMTLMLPVPFSLPFLRKMAAHNEVTVEIGIEVLLMNGKYEQSIRGI